MKNTITTILILLLMSVILQAQNKQSFPMDSEHWSSDPEQVEFKLHEGVMSAVGKENAYYMIRLKDHQFTDGTIEFDVELTGMGFPGISFRMSDDLLHGEHFYIRSFGPVSPEVRTTVQYAAVVDSTSMWDLTDEYQSGATIHQEAWNHVKLVIHGNQMVAYVNDMETPVLRVPQLEGGNRSGDITLNGNVIYSNFTITPEAVEDVQAEAGFDYTENDTRYLRNWQVSAPIDFPTDRDLVIAMPSMYGERQQSDYPTDGSDWIPVRPDYRSMINISREYGMQRGGGRRLVWMGTTVMSAKEQLRELKLGFSDEVWLFVNGELIYQDKNFYGTPSMKEPKGRCTLENATVDIPLKEGENIIMVALANYFYGWGLIARFDQMSGIKFHE
jgi:hypothetical protein